ncbi:2-amino-4-hydroxy-6-hydroxymethyldihydropteridine pyrophosphokinase [Alkalidesulfovibrio alkalitolerans DSM 16529]|uniref:2-amino-4-hydroxy-6-hydroxymethyldihydropteridine pyrophosphokinase n=2 Tax=Alkalidesulfovibrio alkalitolerans TaxID=293256 RepID=S7T006_9BACT|nr:2-amino-4-hydroxy-6-hydroxymethyldihydropteridine pyrophosphokinase [Alkalidesulfovibrio alkalitolerans DSM 16529]
MERIAAIPGITPGMVSSVFQTEPQDVREQPWFANCVLQVFCGEDIGPHDLLRSLRSIEDEFGRERTVRFGPRTLDIDILLFGDLAVEDEELTIPHPRMRQRAFVLAPLAEIAPDLRLPWGETATEALSRLAHRCEGRRIYQEP